MKIFRGDQSKNFEIENGKSSRYGFPCLFFSTTPDLAILFAKFFRKNTGNGFVYEAEIFGRLPEYDFGSEISYSPKFRNLIYKIQAEGKKAALIKNVIDYPSEEFRDFSLSEIIVVFDFSIIYNLKISESEFNYI